MGVCWTKRGGRGEVGASHSLLVSSVPSMEHRALLHRWAIKGITRIFPFFPPLPPFYIYLLRTYTPAVEKACLQSTVYDPGVKQLPSACLASGPRICASSNSAGYSTSALKHEPSAHCLLCPIQCRYVRRWQKIKQMKNKKALREGGQRHNGILRILYESLCWDTAFF